MCDITTNNYCVTREIDRLRDALTFVKPRYCNHLYLNEPLCELNKNLKNALLDRTEVGRVLYRERVLLGWDTYDCANTDIKLLEGCLRGDFELAILDDYERPFKNSIKQGPKKEVMRRFSIIANNYMNVFDQWPETEVVEGLDFEDSCQIAAAEAYDCDCIITSDAHLLQRWNAEPLCVSPEAFLKMHGINNGWNTRFNFQKTRKKPDGYLQKILNMPSRSNFSKNQ